LKWEKDEKVILLLEDAQKWTVLTNLRNFISATKFISTNSRSDKVDNWIKWAETVLNEQDFIQSNMEKYIDKYSYKPPEKKNTSY